MGKWRQEDHGFKASLGKGSKTPSKKTKQRLDIVTHACNPSYSEDWDWEDCCLKPAGDKKLVGPHVTKQAGCGGMFLSSQPHRKSK
jgi:hypothetical protein